MENSEKKYKVLEGSMLEILPTLEEKSFDCCITDPPYELNFMGKGWDNSGIAFQKETWEQVYRVLKSGAYLIAFGGSRTFHRIACAIEDAGFEIRDTIMWLYGSGFPKSYSVDKCIESQILNGSSGVKDIKKLEGKKTEYKSSIGEMEVMTGYTKENYIRTKTDVIFKTEEGRKWKGYGTCLKPAFEPIIVARKPVEKTIVNNVLKYGCGAINIDECRIPLDNEKILVHNAPKGTFAGGEHERGSTKNENGEIDYTESEGRFPANVILTYDETDFNEVCGGMPYTKSTGGSGEASTTKCFNNVKCGSTINTGANLGGLGDEGSAARYFYCAKASKKDRDDGLDLFDEKEIKVTNFTGLPRDDGSMRENTFKKNIHPTVKPVELMQYLVRMFSPKGANILDCFAGSGSTGKAVMFENREREANYTITMVELTKEYVPIIKARCDYATDKYEYEAKQEEIKRKEKGEISIFDYEYTD